MAKSMDDAHPPSLAQVWQLPLLAVSLGLFGVGLFLAAPHDPVPAFSAELDAVTALVSAGQYAPAVDRLESLGGDLEGLPAPVAGRYFLAKADALYLARNSKTSPKSIKPRTIAAAYRAAEKNGQKLTPPRLGRLADVLVAMEQIDEALVVLARVPTGDSPLRQQILKRIIAVVPHEPGGEDGLARRLIDDLMAEPEISDHNRVWAVAQDAERLLSDGRVTDAVDFLLRRITTLANDGIKAVGPLLVLLGEAYLREGDPRHAEQSLMQAQALLPPTDGQQARILVALGQIRLAEGNAIEAHEHFEQVVSGFSQASALPQALIGRAEANARRGAVDEALADYDRAVQQIRSGRWPDVGLDASLHASLQHQHDLRYGQGDFPGAVKFLQLRSRLAAEGLPPTVLRQLADTHEQIARSELGLTDLQADPAKIWSGVEKVKRIRALHHFEIAARFYRRHARAVSRRDDEAFSRSLWKSGVLFDLTGKTEQAIEVFNQYVEGRPSDPRRLEATFRLAQAEQAAGRFDRAVQFYDQL
ncbi:MAG: tetratricopeptide repeat protein, partial [Phycisphaerae bacterium]|nr:tetratricopeptide repeat protein [Phycisphaerae bacterium]